MHLIHTQQKPTTSIIILCYRKSTSFFTTAFSTSLLNLHSSLILLDCSHRKILWMTNYGTIPTSSSGSGGANLEYISRAKERIKEGLATRRPWREMFDIRSIGFTTSVREVTGRIKTNAGYFSMNYAIIVLGIVFLSLLWHPISLIVFIVLMAVWLFLYFLRDEPLVIFGRLITDRVVLIVLSILTIALLLLTGATTNIIVSVLIGIVLVLIHAALRRTDNLVLDEEAALLASSRGPTTSS